MQDVLGYEGKRVVVTGAASGMGEAAAQLLVDLGAEVIALDVKQTAVKVSASITVDLGDRAAIDVAVSDIGGPTDAVFSVAGLPGPPFSDLDTVTVNFVGARYLIESLLPTMPPGAAICCVASVGGLGWQADFPALLPLLSSNGFDEARAWCEANTETIAASTAYIFSKKALNAWVAWRSSTLIQRRIRLNCINPGPTNTGMMPAFEAQHGAALVDAFIGPAGRRSSPEEQAWPLLFLNSPRSSYIAGECLMTDAGFNAALETGQFDARLPADVAADV